MSLDMFETHTVSVTRTDSSLASQASLPLDMSINTDYDDPAVIKFTIPAGQTATFDISGVYANTAQTEQVIFDGGVINEKISLSLWDGITSIESSGGNASSVSISVLGASGQPFATDRIVYSSLKCRISHGTAGNLNINFGVDQTDYSSLYTFSGINTIKTQDRVKDLISGKEYLVIDVDEVYDYERYHHTKAQLSLK